MLRIFDKFQLKLIRKHFSLLIKSSLPYTQVIFGYGIAVFQFSCMLDDDS
jgi:hypothetical protein